MAVKGQGNKVKNDSSVLRVKKHLACMAKEGCDGTWQRTDRSKLNGRVGTDLRMSFDSHYLCSCSSSCSKTGWTASLVVSVCSLLSQLSKHHPLQHMRVTERGFWRIKYHHLCCPVFIEVVAQGHYFNDAQIFLISLLSYFFTFLHPVCHTAREILCFLPIPKGLFILLRKVWDHRGH